MEANHEGSAIEVVGYFAKSQLLLEGSAAGLGALAAFLKTPSRSYCKFRQRSGGSAPYVGYLEAMKAIRSVGKIRFYLMDDRVAVAEGSADCFKLLADEITSLTEIVGEGVLPSVATHVHLDSASYDFISADSDELVVQLGDQIR